MQDFAKIVGTATVWAGVSGLGWVAHLGGHIDGGGFCLLGAAGFALTILIWKPNIFDRWLNS